jgi:hypothetical protein
MKSMQMSEEVKKTGRTGCEVMTPLDDPVDGLLPLPL